KPVGVNWYEKGVEALRNGAYQQASVDFERAIKAGVGLPMAHARLAECYLELDNKEKAKSELYEFTKLVPDLSMLSKADRIYFEAVQAIDAVDYGRAIDRYKELVGLNPDKAYAYVDLGRALEKNNQTDAALTNYQEAAKRDP